MGSVVEYACVPCAFSTGRLSIGWGKAGRGRFWGGLARCEVCKELSVVNLAERPPDRGDRKCVSCNGPLKLLEGMAEAVACPHCSKPLRHSTLGSWA
jgi:hypothetical protein